MHPVGSYCTDVSRCAVNKTLKIHFFKYETKLRLEMPEAIAARARACVCALRACACARARACVCVWSFKTASLLFIAWYYALCVIGEEVQRIHFVLMFATLVSVFELHARVVHGTYFHYT